MKFQITMFIKKAVALILSTFMSIFSGIFPGDNISVVRPDKNTVTAYDKSSADYILDINAANRVHDISDLLFGIFFEDINFAADGGLYAEKIVNRSFEFTEIAENDQLFGWNTVGGASAEVKINAEDALNENNPNYLVITNKSSAPAGVANKGFLDGMSVEANKNYKFSVYAKSVDGYDGAVCVRLMHGTDVIGEAKIDFLTDEWKKYQLTVSSSETAFENVTLQVLIDNGKAAFDMVSLFPEETFKNRENGVRKDLGEMLEALEPKFLRFPGGCIIEGYNYDTA